MTIMRLQCKKTTAYPQKVITAMSEETLVKKTSGRTTYSFIFNNQ